MAHGATRSNPVTLRKRSDCWAVVASMFIWAVSTTMVAMLTKAAGELTPMAIVILARWLMSAIVLFLISKLVLAVQLSTTRPASHLLRGLCGCVASLGFALSLQRLPLATAMALSHTAVGWALILNGLVLGGALSRIQFAGLLLGAGGVLLILGPSITTGRIALVGVLLGLGAAMAAAVGQLLLARHAITEPPMRSAFLYAVFSAVGAAPFAILERPVALIAAWPLFVLIGVIGAVGQVVLAKGYSADHYLLAASFDYVRLPVALFAGLIVFGEHASLSSLAGMGVILAGCSMTTIGTSHKNSAHPAMKWRCDNDD